MIEVQRNPMQLVEVKGISKRLKKSLILTVGEYFLVLDLLPQPYHTMVVVAQCLGLRAEEVLALHWSDVSFERLIVRVSKAVVSCRIKTVKTEYSEDELPLDPDFATVLLDWKTRTPASALMFPSHVTGRNFHASPIQQDYIRPAGCCWWHARTVPLHPGHGARMKTGRAARRAMGFSGQLWARRVAYVPPYVPLLAGRDRGSAGSAAETHAARPDLDHNERIWQRADGSQTRGKYESCKEGTGEFIAMQRTLQTHRKTLGVLGNSVISGYSGLAFRLSGCGGRI